MGGGNNNVIIRCPSLNEYRIIILNGDLNGNIDTGTSNYKYKVWNFMYGYDAIDYTILQNNTTTVYTNILWNEVNGLGPFNVPKTYISGGFPGNRVSGDANFRPVFEFKQ